VSPRPAPPRVARACLRRVLPADVRDDVSADLDEVFDRDSGTVGVPRARRRYRRQAASFAWHFILDRLRDGVRLPGAPSSMDFKLGLRMLIRYPGLTIVGGLAVAFAIALTAGGFEIVRQVARPTVPLPDGDRLVGIRLWHVAARGVEEQALYDFFIWRDSVRSVADLGAFRTLERNLIAPAGLAWPVQVAEMTASGFRAAGVQPLMGRVLVDADERPAAPPVLVVSHRVWQSQLGSDPGVIGLELRLGDAPVTVVGVMPPAFEFPVAHDAWTPFRLNPVDYGPRQGPWIEVFGRLPPGVPRGRAQAELAAIGARLSVEQPESHEHLRPEVLPYAQSMSVLSYSPDELAFALASINVPAVLLLILVCGNVGLLLFARAAARDTEIGIRYALGASRGRIVAQLFAEAVVLASFGGLVGLAAARYTLRWALQAIEAEVFDGGGRFPFWFGDQLAPATILYAGLLVIVCAVIAGVLPALRITRGSGPVPGRSSGGRSPRFGGAWTALIVTQVAVTVAFPAVAFYVQRDAVQIRSIDVGFQDEAFLTARLEMEAPAGSTAPGPAIDRAPRFRRARQELTRRLASEPGVAGVTVAELLPRMYHSRRFIELDEGGAAPPPAPWLAHGVSTAAFDVDTLDVLEAPILQGRGFHSGDFAAGAPVAIVNRSFVARVLGGRNPIGRRLRFLPMNESGQVLAREAAPGPWHQIIGVVRDMGMAEALDPKVAGLYLPLTADAYPLHVAVHVAGDPMAFAPRLRTLAATIDPTLRLERVAPLSDLAAAELQFLAFWFRVTALVSLVALVLSLAGIYAVMAFTVSRRTREIGIRVALGARPGRVVAAIFRRPLTHVGAGIAAGLGLVALLTFLIQGSDLFSAVAVAVFAAYAVVMTAICLLACVAPTRRALRVDPIDAMRIDG
jgi:predicted permease